MQRHPEWATFVGDPRFADRLEDASPEAEAAEYAALRAQRAELLAIDAAALGATDRVSRDVFLYLLDDQLATEPHVGRRRLSLGSQGGLHTLLPQLLQATPLRSSRQVEQAIARLQAWPRRIDQEIARLRQGQALGWVGARPVLERVVATLDGQLRASEAQSPFLLPFQRLGEGIAPAEQDRLRERVRQVVQADVLPAQQRLRDFLVREQLPLAPAAGNLANYPGGAAAYDLEVRSNTTTDLDAEAVHAIGLREVARLRGEMLAVLREMRWPETDFAGFVRRLNTDPKYFVADADALLDAYRAIGKRIDAELPRLFAELPRVPWGVRAMPPHMGPDSAEYYSGPPLDGSSPGWFNANALAVKKRPTWGMETLTAHEAVPGHHLQVARAMELGELPRFRRAAGFTAYSEGWALYAETLGSQMGLYTTPESRFGHLQWQMVRAARLVVDTGIHRKGWSRQQAIDYLVDMSGEDRDFLTAEVDRYTSWPGQALGYMIGQLQIVALRDRARAALGERFDIRRFHNAVLDQGAVPLAVLGGQIDAWIAAEQARR